nr:eIF-2-alpha kinase activator GCN1 isoform X12 [Ipomoea batatas]
MPATRRKPALLPQPPLPPKRKERTMKMWRSQMRKPLNTSPKSKEFWSCSRRIGIWCLVKLTIMIEDPRDVERKRLLGIDDENAPTREDLAAALEEVGSVIKNPEISALVPTLLMGLTEPNEHTKYSLDIILQVYTALP